MKMKNYIWQFGEHGTPSYDVYWVVRIQRGDKVEYREVPSEVVKEWWWSQESEEWKKYVKENYLKWEKTTPKDIAEWMEEIIWGEVDWAKEREKEHIEKMPSEWEEEEHIRARRESMEDIVQYMYDLLSDFEDFEDIPEVEAYFEKHRKAIDELSDLIERVWDMDDEEIYTFFDEFMKEFNIYTIEDFVKKLKGV